MIEVVQAVFAGANLALGLWIAFMLIGHLPVKQSRLRVEYDEVYSAICYQRRGTQEWVYMVYSPISGFKDISAVPPNERDSQYIYEWLRGYGIHRPGTPVVSETHAHAIREALDRVARPGVIH